MCFSAAAIEQFLIWLVLACAIIGILKILLPWILSLAGIGVSGQVGQIINIVIIAVVLIMVIILCFGLFECVGGLRLPGR